MIFNKARIPNIEDDVLFIDASREFAQGTNQNRLRAEDIDMIVGTYRHRETIEKYSYLAPFNELEENEFNLNIPRYVDTFESEPEIDIPAVQMEIEELEAKLHDTREKMNSYLKELGLGC